MMKALSIALIAVGFGGAMLSFWASTVEAQSSHAVVVEIDEPIQPSTARFLERVVNEAEDGGARFVVIRLNTPGGLYDSTRDIVETILESTIPVIVYVSPSGAQAASAGTFIATAGHITAMANGTNIGAASPVDQGGGPLPEAARLEGHKRCRRVPAEHRRGTRTQRRRLEPNGHPSEGILGIRSPQPKRHRPCREGPRTAPLDHRRDEGRPLRRFHVRIPIRRASSFAP